MIKNISNDIVTIKWGGVEKVLCPGQVYDVTAMSGGVAVNILEDRFINKFPGKIDRYIQEIKVEIPVHKVEVIIPKPVDKPKPVIKAKGRKR